MSDRKWTFLHTENKVQAEINRLHKASQDFAQLAALPKPEHEPSERAKALKLPRWDWTDDQERNYSNGGAAAWQDSVYRLEGVCRLSYVEGFRRGIRFEQEDNPHKVSRITELEAEVAKLREALEGFVNAHPTAHMSVTEELVANAEQILRGEK